MAAAFCTISWNAVSEGDNPSGSPTATHLPLHKGGIGVRVGWPVLYTREAFGLQGEGLVRRKPPGWEALDYRRVKKVLLRTKLSTQEKSGQAIGFSYFAIRAANLVGMSS